MFKDVNYEGSIRKRPFPLDVARGSKRRAVTLQDDGRTLKSTTAIAGHSIACFVVGGEPRLCLPQLLRLMVDRVDVEQVESARRKLSVNLAECESDQLAALHNAKVLPPSVSSCGLVTLSDATRLVSGLSEFLRHHDTINQDRKLTWSLSDVDDVTDHDRKWTVYGDVINRDRKWSQSNSADDSERLPVCHSCFGGCSGTLFRRDNIHVRCDECSVAMSPEHFVTHSHRLDAESSATCHWGFDATRWRHYVMLNSAAMTSPEVTCRLQAALDDVKQLYDDEFPVQQVPGCPQVIELCVDM